MIGIVLVSHSEPLATATAELALQMAGDDPPPLRIAAGADGALGTDAVAIAAAIDGLAERVDGVLVIPDLGSGVLSAELALDLRESAVPVTLSDGPFVEGAVLAVVTAAGGADLAAVAGAASDALRVKRGDSVLDEQAPESGPETVSAEVVLPNPQGLHARPAAVLARAAAGLAADIRVTDFTTGRGPVDAASVIALLALGTAGGHALRVEASGDDAQDALDEVVALIRGGLGETV